MNKASRLLVAVATLFLPVMAQQAPSVFAFTHVTVIDVTAGRALPDMTVVVAGGRISSMGKSGSTRAPASAVLVEARGKFLIPGLWDMHVHWYDEDFLPLFLTNGVTGMRIMWGYPVHHEWRKSIENGTLLGPRMVIASNLIDGPNSFQPTSTVVRDEAEARAAVRKAKQDGADFIKVYTLLSREAYFAIADEAKKQGLPFSGHIPISVGAAGASDAGQGSVEHLYEIIESASSRAEELGNERLAAAANRPVDPATFQRHVQRAFKDTFDRERATALMVRFKRNRTWQTPTLTTLRGQLFLDPNLRNDPRLKYIRANLRENWQMAADRAQQRTPEDLELANWRWQKYLELVGMMDRAGVPILAGTDVFNPWCLPGFGLHDELALLVQAGLTPAAALRAATINPARFLGREADLGTISRGKIADLVLLDANPLQDIRNTTRIRSVVVNGRLLDRAALDKMLSQVEAVASASQKTASQKPE